MRLSRLLIRAATDAAAATAATSAVIVAASRRENAAPWAAINEICHIVDGDEREYSSDFSPRDTLLGMVLSGSALFGWAWLYETFFGRVRFPRSLAAGSATAAGAYLIDYFVVPKRFTPGIEKKIGAPALFLTYAVLAACLSLSPLWNAQDEPPAGK